MSSLLAPSTTERRRSEPRHSLVAVAGMGILALWALTLGLCAFYITIPGDPIGRPNDFIVEAMPPLRQMYDGHLLAFFQIAPSYVGSLLARAPLALAVIGLHGDWQAVYAATALPCVAAAPVLGAWLSRRHDINPGGTTRSVWLWLSPFGLLMVINPIFIYSLILGHPEDVLGASLVIAGVVQAAGGRPRWSMLLLGLAVANKSWALVGVPVAVALMPRVDIKALLIFGVSIAVAYIPIYVIQQEHGTAIGVSTGTIFMASQLWWWFGPHFWIVVHAHVLIILTATALSAWWRLVARRQLGAGRNRTREGLILLALVLLLRAAMDPWDNVYYQLPFLMTVYALELGRLPKWSFVATVLMTLGTVPFYRDTLAGLAISYQLVAVPLICWLLLRVFLSPERWTALVHWATAPRRVTAPANR